MLLLAKFRNGSGLRSRLIMNASEPSLKWFSATGVKSAVIQVELDRKLEEKLSTAELKVNNL